MTTTEAPSILDRLEDAKRNVRYLLDHPTASVDFHGLAYWAGVVERLRDEIRQSL